MNCKSIGCRFYDRSNTMFQNCLANESLLEKCMSNQQSQNQNKMIVEVLEIGLENTIECSNNHLNTYGTTTAKNKRIFENYKKEQEKIKNLIKELTE